jgi:hypothetical protein
MATFRILYDKLAEATVPGAEPTTSELDEVASVLTPTEGREIEELRRFAAALDEPDDLILFTAT